MNRREFITTTAAAMTACVMPSATIHAIGSTSSSMTADPRLFSQREFLPVKFSDGYRILHKISDGWFVRFEQRGIMSLFDSDKVGAHCFLDVQEAFRVCDELEGFEGERPHA